AIYEGKEAVVVNSDQKEHVAKLLVYIAKAYKETKSCKRYWDYFSAYIAVVNSMGEEDRESFNNTIDEYFGIVPPGSRKKGEEIEEDGEEGQREREEELQDEEQEDDEDEELEDE
ncbi:UNVERIFIED_CONTAM: hypothetical protein HDU68_007764, partial [Siphonaria sp. JEL0065]